MKSLVILILVTSTFNRICSAEIEGKSNPLTDFKFTQQFGKYFISFNVLKSDQSLISTDMLLNSQSLQKFQDSLYASGSKVINDLLKNGILDGRKGHFAARRVRIETVTREAAEGNKILTKAVIAFIDYQLYNTDGELQRFNKHPISLTIPFPLSGKVDEISVKVEERQDSIYEFTGIIRDW